MDEVDVKRALARRQRLTMVALGVMLGGLALGAIAAGAEPFDPVSFGPGQDARAYWAAASDAPYRSPVGAESAYLYSPAFLQVLEPLRALPWTAFLVVWSVVLLAAALALAGPLLLAGAILFAFIEMWGGNIHLLLALAIVAGFRWPAAWAFVLLTKVTPGIGLLWFVVRREWRAVGIAAAATLGVAALSWLLAPAAWQEWVTLLSSSTGASTVPGSVPVPLIVRLPFAVAIVLWGARTDRRWTVPVAAFLALPVIWWGGFSLLLGAIALERGRLERALMALLVPDVAPRGAAPATVEATS